MNKEEFECFWAERFMEQFHPKGSNYIVPGSQANINRSLNLPDIDAVVIFNDGRENLYLQLWQDRGETQYEKNGAEHFEPNRILESLNAKEHKYERQKKDISRVVALIHGSAGYNIRSKIESIRELVINSGFLAIYYISFDSRHEKYFTIPIKGGLPHPEV